MTAGPGAGTSGAGTADLGTSDGEQLPVWTLDAVDQEKMKVLALLLADPNPLHFDPAAAPALGIAARPVNQGPSNMAMLVNMLRAAYPGARLRRLRVQLRGSVIAGQPVRAGGQVTGREAGRIRASVWLEAGGAVVLTGDAELEPVPARGSEWDPGEGHLASASPGAAATRGSGADPSGFAAVRGAGPSPADTPGLRSGRDGRRRSG